MPADLVLLAAGAAQASNVQLVVTAALSAALGGLAAFCGSYALERRKMLWHQRAELYSERMPPVFDALDGLRDGAPGADVEVELRLGQAERVALLTTRFELDWVRALHADARRLRQEPDPVQRELLRRQLADRVARFNHQLTLSLRWRARRVPWPNGFPNRREHYN